MPLWLVLYHGLCCFIPFQTTSSLICKFLCERRVKQQLLRNNRVCKLSLGGITIYQLNFMKTKVVFGLCKSIFEKYSIFQKCYFLERKMFSYAWLHFKKFSEKYFLVFGKEEGKDKPKKTQTKPRENPKKKSSTIDARLGSTARCFASSSSRSTARSHEGEIAIDGVISRRREDRD